MAEYIHVGHGHVNYETVLLLSVVYTQAWVGRTEQSILVEESSDHILGVHIIGASLNTAPLWRSLPLAPAHSYFMFS